MTHQDERSRASKARTEHIDWLPAERLGQLAVDSQLRPWLIGKGLLTLRLKAACAERYALRLVNQWSGVLSGAHQAAMRSVDHAGLFREVEMSCGEQVWVYAQTVMPDSTLCAHPWLAELGASALGETLSGLSGFERSSYEYAYLPAEQSMTARALRAAQVKPAGLWARRSRMALRGAPLLIHELFLPCAGRL